MRRGLKSLPSGAHRAHREKRDRVRAGTATRLANRSDGFLRTAPQNNPDCTNFPLGSVV